MADAPLQLMLSTLELVYPPVSNQEADWVRHVPEVESLLRNSDLYMLGWREEAFFDDQSWTEKGGVLTIPILLGDRVSDVVEVSPWEIAEDMLGFQPDRISFEIGPKMLRFYGGPEEAIEDGRAELFAWFTSEKLFYDRACGVSGIRGLERLREFTTYELLYVGIAKKKDTFERLFSRAHDARQNILTREFPKRLGGRVSDELYLFPFRVDPVTVCTLTEGNDFHILSDGEWGTHCRAIVADAEKAFVSLFDPEYNVVKYAKYPQGKDGLFGYGYQRYWFVIGENLTFTTRSLSVRGARRSSWGLFDGDCDAISIAGNTVEVWTEGVPLSVSQGQPDAGTGSHS